jgi:chromosome segregation ATPase
MRSKQKEVEATEVELSPEVSDRIAELTERSATLEKTIAEKDAFIKNAFLQKERLED